MIDAFHPVQAPVVELENVSMIYRKGWTRTPFPALSNVSLSIAQGETVGFIGNNGAGKSSTLRIVLGLQKQTSGNVRLRGLAPHEPLSRRGVAYVPESPFLYDYLTPMELLQIGAQMHRCQTAADKSGLEKHCMRWLDRFGISHVANKRIRTFSKGMTQRTALAHALACEPDFLILDEPLSGLDPIGRQEVVAILDEFRNLGKTLFFSSHVLTDVERLADRFVFIHKGKIQAARSTSDLFSPEPSRFAVIVEGEVKPDGFSRVSSRLWQREVDETELPSLLALVASLGRKSGVRLYAVRNLNGLERAYARFIGAECSI